MITNLTEKENEYIKDNCNNYPIITPFNGSIADIVKDLKQINKGNKSLKSTTDLFNRYSEVQINKEYYSKTKEKIKNYE